MTHNISLRFGADSGVKNGEKVVVKMLYFTDFIERSIEFQDSTPDSNNISLKLHKTKEVPIFPIETVISKLFHSTAPKLSSKSATHVASY